MQTYETLMILKPTLDKDVATALVKKIQVAITKNGGSEAKIAEWGVKRLSFEIKKCKEGNYILLEYTGVTDTVRKVQEYIKLQTDILRSATTLKPRPPLVVPQAQPVAGVTPTEGSTEPTKPV